MLDFGVRARVLLARHSRLLLSLGVLVLVFAASGTAAAVDGGAVDLGAFADVTLGDGGDVTTDGSGDANMGPTEP
jgi:hypothetical protein